MVSKNIGEQNLGGNLQTGIENNINAAKKYFGEQQTNVGTAVHDHPVEFILGAFVGGLLLGTLFAKRDS